MKASPLGGTVAAILGITALGLIAIGPPGSRKPAIVAEQPEAPPPSSVSGGGITLVSSTIDLPIDEEMYPDGPNAEVVNSNCTSCHSASMAMTQPMLSAKQWEDIVTKMRDVYRAPVADADVDLIVAYLAAMPSQRPSGRGENEHRDSAEDASGSTG